MATPCYTPRYFPASYKGVPFRALDTSSEHGRRGAEGEFPFGERTGYADLGRRIRKYSIEGQFLTNDHIAEAAALIRVVETPGPGLLVHPTRGAVMAACVTLKVKDNPIDEAGITNFSMELVEGNDWIGALNLGIRFDLGLGVATLVALLADVFTFGYRPVAVPFYDLDRSLVPARAVLSALSDQIRRAIAASATDHDNAWWAASDLLNYTGDISALQDPNRVLQAINLGSLALASVTSGAAKFEAFRSIANTAAKVTALRGIGGTTQNSAWTAARTIAGLHMVQATLEEKPPTLAKAFERLDQIDTLFLDEIAAARVACNNPLHTYLLEARVTALKTAMSVAYDLPSVITYDFSSAQHSLVIAYEILADARRRDEIEAKNPRAFPWAVGPLVASGRA